MQSTSALITAIGNALVNDAAINAWCLAQFTQSLAVYEGDPEDIAPPAIAILSVTGHDRAENNREIVRQVLIGCAVENTATVTSGNKTVYTGMHQAETMREMAEDAIYRAHLGSVTTEFSSDPDVRHPLYVVYAAISIAELKTTRQRLPG